MSYMYNNGGKLKNADSVAPAYTVNPSSSPGYS